MSRRWWMATILLLAGAACGRDWDIFTIIEETEGSCSEGLETCGETCVDLNSSPAHCGACDTACSVTQVCLDGSCQTSCGLDDFDEDPWGVRWEKTNSGPSPHADAVLRCDGVGARLPTVSEAARAIVAGVVDAVPNANLWTIVPASPSRQMAVRFEQAANLNAAAANYERTASHLYRCVCAPTAATEVFTDTECEREQSESCPEVPGFGSVTVNIDARDRPAMPKRAAMWECQFSGAHMLDWLSLEATRTVGTVSTRNLWAADHHGRMFFPESVTLALDDAMDPALDTRLGSGDLSGSHSFRCVGVGSSDAPPAPLLASPWQPPAGTHLRGQTMASEADSSAPSEWIDAVRVCAERGGHLPAFHELAQLALVGLTASPGEEALWVTDRSDAAIAMQLPNTPDELDWTTSIVEADRSEQRPFRCITYPLFTRSGSPTCNGGCENAVLPNTEVQMWIDGMDRAEVTFAEAVQTCIDEGGRLASERDLIEMMYHTDLTGSGEWVMTSTITEATSPTKIRMRWTDAGDYEGREVSNGNGDMDLSSNEPTNAFRCVWTNELR